MHTSLNCHGKEARGDSRAPSALAQQTPVASPAGCSPFSPCCRPLHHRSQVEQRVCFIPAHPQMWFTDLAFFPRLFDGSQPAPQVPFSRRNTGVTSADPAFISVFVDMVQTNPKSYIIRERKQEESRARWRSPVLLMRVFWACRWPHPSHGSSA